MSAERLDSLADLPDFALEAGRGPTSRASLEAGLDTFGALAAHIRALPYGRVGGRGDWRSILSAGKGTCSTKHAFLAEVAREHEEPVELIVGIYMMNGDNTPGVGPALEAAGLEMVPEAHCYLRHDGARVDLTRPGGSGRPPRAVEEVVIASEQVVDWKVRWHRRWLERWATGRGLDPEATWAVREACIAALSNHGQTTSIQRHFHP